MKEGDGVEDSDYVSAVALHYMCDTELAKIIISSAKQNGTMSELNKIVENIVENKLSERKDDEQHGSLESEPIPKRIRRTRI